MGAPGYEVWEFKAKAGNYRVVQVGHIVMEYARPWENTRNEKRLLFILNKNSFDMKKYDPSSEPLT